MGAANLHPPKNTKVQVSKLHPLVLYQKPTTILSKYVLSKGQTCKFAFIS